MEKSQFFSKIFLWMFIGLAVTFCTGALVASSANALQTVFSSGMYIFLVIAELITVIVLSVRLHKMSAIGAKIGFIFYSFLSGLTFSSIFVVYNLTSIMVVFLVTALIFFTLAIIGYITKSDISKFGTILFVSLIAIIVLSLVNMFVLSESLNLGLCIFGVIIFMGYICYDVNKIKNYYLNSGELTDNLVIYAALELYLDFINLFLRLLQLFGKSKD